MAKTKQIIISTILIEKVLKLNAIDRYSMYYTLNSPLIVAISNTSNTKIRILLFLMVIWNHKFALVLRLFVKDFLDHCKCKSFDELTHLTPDDGAYENFFNPEIKFNRISDCSIEHEQSAITFSYINSNPNMTQSRYFLAT